jgi:arginine/lysine/ornithine decarboxylase
MESQELNSRFVGAEHRFFLVNGSSVGVHAGILSVLGRGDKVIVGRDMHLSAVNAFALAGAKPVLLHPSASGTDFFGVLTPEDVRRAVLRHPDAKAVYVTYPNYYGLCSDINEICAVAHRAGMKVICDAAHGAAFDYSGLLPAAPAGAGCDIWVVSLHKTLPAMNQCAVLSIGSGVDGHTVQSRLNMLQTTSPSYVLLGSCDYALGYMRGKGKEKLNNVIYLVEDNIRKIEALGGYRCVTKDVPVLTGAYDRDILKLVIDVTDRGMSGFTAAKQLAAAGICVEAADVSNVLLICSVADGKEDFDRLKSALYSLKGANYSIQRSMTASEIAGVFDRQLSMDISSAVFAKKRNVPLLESVDETAGVCVGAYPPGVPVIIPGQKITYDMVDYIARMRQQGYAVFGSDGNIDIVEG